MGSSESVHQSKRYSLPISQIKQNGFSKIYRNPKCMQKLVDTPDQKFNTMKDIIYNSVQKYGDKDYLGNVIINQTTDSKGNKVDSRSLVKYTYRQSFNMAQKIGSYVLQNNLSARIQDRGINMNVIGIYSKNRAQWMMVDVACIIYGMTLVPLYQTLGVDNLTYCLQHSQITSLFVTAATAQSLLKLNGYGRLKNLISFDQIPNQLMNQLRKRGFNLFSLTKDILPQNNIIDHRNIPVQRNNILTFCYTSGTTGPPKGALLTQGNFLAFVAAFRVHEINSFVGDTYLSFLPLPHVFQRAVQMAMVADGAFVVFYNGDITKFKDDIQFIKPSIFIGVPRVFSRISQGVQKQFNQATGVKGCLINKGLKSKMETLRNDGQFKSSLYDSIVFDKVKQKFGGNIRLMISGSAPIRKQDYQFMKVILCCPFYQGYGQTQNTAAAFITSTIDNLAGHVGGVVGSLQFKLNDIQQMGYTSQDKDQLGRSTPRGQVWLRGPSVFMGYYKDAQKTSQALTQDGWLRTGDVGMILPHSNALKIIDRRKNIFKLQQGQYVAAQKVQDVYSKCKFIQQSFIHGDSNQSYVVAIIVPKQQQILKLAKQNAINGSIQQLCKNKRIRQLVVKQLDTIGKKNKLVSFQQAKNVFFQLQPFQNIGLLSSTMKLQRFLAKKHYAPQIKAMYQQGMILTK